MLKLFVVSLVVGITSAVTSAQPGLVTPAPADTSSYVGGGVMLGGVQSNSGATGGGLYGAYELEAGVRLGRVDTAMFWAHVMLAHGGMARIDDEVSSSDYTEARVGVEAPVCTAHKIACLLVGVDVGVRHERLMDEDGNLDATNIVIVPRLGLDLGSRHFRVRPSFEFAFGTDGDGAALVLSTAYTW